jgi:G3E family GTPase
LANFYLNLLLLGSGKTTLIQYILQSPDHGKRIAVIENEFGGDGLNIESMIARDGAQSLTDLIELPNGCVCCTVKDNLVKTLETLLDKRNDLDYILIESSGMANPGPIATIFWLDDALESRLRLDGVITLVDAMHISQQLQETEEAEQQIAYADRVLLNKIDLVDDKKQQQVLDTIRAINPTVPIRTTTYSQVPELDWILDSNCFGRAMDVDQAAGPTATDNQSSGPPTLNSGFCMPVAPSPLAASSHKHTTAVATVSFNCPGTVDLQKINSWLASILWPNQDEKDKVLRARLESKEVPTHKRKAETTTMQLFRVKGILSVKHSNLEEEDQPFVDGSSAVDTRRFIVQAVYDLWEINPASEDLSWDAGEERSCKLVIIGRHLQHEELHRGFQACMI